MHHSRKADSSCAVAARNQRDQSRFLLFGLAAFLILASLIFVSRAATAAATSAQGAAEFLHALSQRTLRVLEDKSPSPAQKEAQIRALLKENFALELIGRYVAGSAWRKATPEQRVRYQHSFKTWVLNGYVRRLAAYGGGGMKILGARALGRRDVLVSTRVFRKSGPAIRAAWRVRAMAGGYKILDVMVGGVSMTLTQRSEFAAVTRRQGMDGLIQRLHAQVAQIQAKAAGQLASSRN